MHDASRPVRALSFHASYRCRHRGTCCTAEWPIPVEADRLARMRAAISTGALHVASSVTGVDPFVPINDPAAGDPPALLGIDHGACVFFDAEHGGLCEVHRALGHDALPLACRQFPRVCVHDPRGTSVTLSHFCPTAASMLDSDSPIAIVTEADAFPAHGEYAGLDATTSLPPLLRPDVLMDWNAWWEVERRGVDALSPDQPIEIALARLARAVEAIRAWTPSDGNLLGRVMRAFEAATTANVSARKPDDEWLATLRETAIMAIPAELRAHAPKLAPPADDIAPRVLRRFLAAHAFASWTAHLGGGLRSWLRSIEVAYAVALATGDAGPADLILRHLVDPPTLASLLMSAERQPAPRG